MRLRTYLRANELTTEDYAEKHGLSIDTVGKVVRGDRYPRANLAQTIRESTNYQVTADDMLDAALERQGIAFAPLCELCAVRADDRHVEACAKLHCPKTIFAKREAA